MIFENACSQALVAFDEAWDEFSSKKRSPIRDGISVSLRYDIFKRDEYRCQVCGVTAQHENVRLEIDHKIPVVKGGTNKSDNLWTLCFNCNRGKRDKDL